MTVEMKNRRIAGQRATQQIKIEARKFVTDLNGQIELLAEEKDLNSYDFTHEVIRNLLSDWRNKQ